MAKAKNEASFEPRNHFIKDVEFNWPKLVKPVNPFGTEQWELQIATKDKKVADDWKANHLTVKTDKNDDSKYIVNLKRRRYKADGTENKPPRVVDGSNTEIDATNLGNGSKGSVKLYQYAYDVAGRTGISSSLLAVQVADYVSYQSEEDFEPITVEEPTKRPSKKDKEESPESEEDMIKGWANEDK
tara:strand:+ start:401 stop:958 length:558 start_codon:yes stop_codon:yes gene_type:complete